MGVGIPSLPEGVTGPGRNRRRLGGRRGPRKGRTGSLRRQKFLLGSRPSCGCTSVDTSTRYRRQVGSKRTTVLVSTDCLHREILPRLDSDLSLTGRMVPSVRPEARRDGLKSGRCRVPCRGPKTFPGLSVYDLASTAVVSVTALSSGRGFFPTTPVSGATPPSLSDLNL